MNTGSSTPTATRVFNKNFLRLLVFGSPLSALILLVSNGDSGSWYDRGYGWPFFYGWRATDIRPSRPSVENLAAFIADLIVGFVVFLAISLVCRFVFIRYRNASALKNAQH